jgi:multiple sugar transport system permease protein
VHESFWGKFFRFYLPLAVFIIFLLFPFYWMVNTSLKPMKELYNLKLNPFYVHNPTLENVKVLFFETIFLRWMYNTFFVAILSTVLSLGTSLLAAYAIQRLKFKTSGPTGLAIFFGYLIPPTILFIPLAAIIFKLKL